MIMELFIPGAILAVTPWAIILSPIIKNDKHLFLCLVPQFIGIALLLINLFILFNQL